MKKCLHVLPMDKLSGAEKLALIICENLQNYKPVVICGGGNLKDIFEDKGIRTYAVDFNNSIFKSAKEVSKIAKENHIDIIHAHDNTASIVSYISKLIYRLDIKLVSHIHNCYPWLKSNNKNKIIDSIFRKRYDYNIACGKLVYDFYAKYTNYITSKNTSVLSNAIEVKEITKKSKVNKDEIYKQYGIPKDKKVLGFVGRISEQKGIIPFIENVGRYKDKFVDCIFLMVGSGDQDNEAKELVKILNMEEIFIFTGHQDNIYNFYPLMDIFFLPSLYEGLPMVLLEAMSFKKPIVSMNVGSIDEIIRNNGYLIEPGAYDNFINKLDELKDDEEKMKIFGHNSLNIINRDYEIDTYCYKLERIYNLVNGEV
ncbi:glycosyltransferase [Terrisporobacter vanillatitrophus]|uniref:glycosyltransferase n=1 Tax=Terrisporobacter vanillatitrophus TaxID=3058402 RepID=UPI003366FBDB